MKKLSEVVGIAKQEDADVLCLQEVGALYFGEIKKGLKGVYPYSSFCASDYHSDFAVFAKQRKTRGRV